MKIHCSRYLTIQYYLYNRTKLTKKMFSNLIEVLSLNIFNRMSVNETRLINNGESKFYNHCKQVSTRTRSCGVVHHPGPAPPH